MVMNDDVVGFLVINNGYLKEEGEEGEPHV